MRVVQSRLFILSVMAIFVVGCNQRPSSISSLSNYDLAERAYRCAGNDRPAPGTAISCTNIRRECDQRSAQQGYTLC